jgi:hypothetical protein
MKIGASSQDVLKHRMNKVMIVFVGPRGYKQLQVRM